SGTLVKWNAPVESALVSLPPSTRRTTAFGLVVPSRFTVGKDVTRSPVVPVSDAGASVTVGVAGGGAGGGEPVGGGSVDPPSVGGVTGEIRAETQADDRNQKCGATAGTSRASSLASRRRDRRTGRRDGLATRRDNQRMRGLRQATSVELEASSWGRRGQSAPG